MRLRRALALAVLTAGLAVLLDDSSTPAAAQQPSKAELKAKRKAMLAEKAAKAAEDAKAAEAAKTTEAAKTPAKPSEPTPVVSGPPKDPTPLAKLIDTHINKQLTTANLTPSPICTDEEFLRRAYLDLAGIIPSADKAKSFLDSADPHKRAKLIDELLADPHYGKRQADVWYGLLIQRTSDNRRVDFGPTRDWMAEQFNKGRPWSAIVTDLITATGTMDTNPAVGFYLSNNVVDKMTDTCGKLFMGTQIQCAQCHNHPFTKIKQTEYWEMTAFFMKTQVGNVKAKDSSPGVTEVTGNVKRGKNAMLPEAAKILPPKFPNGESPKMAAGEMARPVLAKWLTSPENPYFAKAMVNRTWFQLLGRGFVNPVDDMSPENGPTHPELLDALAKEFGASGFDLKHLVRGICNSQTYQRSTKPTPQNKSDHELFSHSHVKVMTPEQLFDSLSTVTKTQANGKAERTKNGIVQPANRERFINFFLAGADAANPTEYEAGIPQALRLMNSQMTGGPNVLRTIVTPGMKPEEAVTQIYLTALSRRPTADEMKMLTGYVAKNGSGPTTYSDVLWAVLNSSEFTLVR
jgi:hypothetical protein